MMTHHQSLELLPWYDTLDEDQRRELDAHADGCPECARELAEMNTLRETIAPLEDIPEPSAFMLSRTLERIDAYEREMAARPAGWRRITAWWLESAFPVRALIAAQAALIVVLGVGVVHFHRQSEIFSTLAGPTAGAAGARLTVAFQPGVSEETLRQTLRDVQGTIIDGPSALGIYLVQIPRGANAEQISAQLRAQSAVIRLAEKAPEQ